MFFADLELSRRLEGAEGNACVQFAIARSRVAPKAGAAWSRIAGSYVVFDGVDSPITQTFGLGLFEELSAAALDAIEEFFFERGAAVVHEVSPHAGLGVMQILCERSYRPIEVSSVLFRPTEGPGPTHGRGGATARVIREDEGPLWAEISARGWTHEHPELLPFLSDFGAVLTAREESVSFVGEVEGKVGAAGMLFAHEGVALLAGAATVPEMRRKGLQGALLAERLRYAAEHGCDLAMMVTEAGSESQRNAERKGFRVGYTRMKWKLF